MIKLAYFTIGIDYNGKFTGAATLRDDENHSTMELRFDHTQMLPIMAACSVLITKAMKPQQQAFAKADVDLLNQKVLEHKA